MCLRRAVGLSASEMCVTVRRVLLGDTLKDGSLTDDLTLGARQVDLVIWGKVVVSEAWQRP